MSRLTRLFVALVFCWGAAVAGAEPQAVRISPRTRASLVADVRVVAPGKPFLVALKMEFPDGWHAYYNNSGGIERSLEIDWKLPGGFAAGPVQWPVPEVVDGMFGKSYVYGGVKVFLVSITPPASLPTGTAVELEAHARWQICKSSCVNEKATLALSLPVAAMPESDPVLARMFADARASQAAASAAWSIRAEKVPAGYRLRLTPGVGAGDPKDIYFVPDQKFVDSAKSQTLAREGRDWLLGLPVATKDVLGNPIPEGNTLSGILQSQASWESGAATPAILVPETAIVATANPMTYPPLPYAQLLKVLAGMFLGGLFLNLMPCVFPVIGLKILGFVQQAGRHRSMVVLHGVLFSLGVLVSMWVLSGMLFVARAATGIGKPIGWGYQLQNPWVVLVLMMLMFVMALSMYGVFDLGVAATGIGGRLASKQGAAGTFFSGLLATVVATPCSGPLLGPAIGVAVALPTGPFFAAFTAMALGLCLPYLVLSLFPGLVNRLPRPGPWMETFKEAMSFLLFATAGYFLWIYGGQIGFDNMLDPIIGLTLVAIGAWIYGRWHTILRSRRVRRTVLVSTLVFGLAGIYISKPPDKSPLAWEHWSEQRVAELLAQGKPVYVDFTAQWCATCQFNKKRAYTKEVADLVRQRGITLLKGDKTNPDPAIEAKLSELGRTAIPVNVLYVPGKPPIITPERLTADYLLDLIRANVPTEK